MADVAEQADHEPQERGGVAAGSGHMEPRQRT